MNQTTALVTTTPSSSLVPLPLLPAVLIARLECVVNPTIVGLLVKAAHEWSLPPEACGALIGAIKDAPVTMDSLIELAQGRATCTVPRLRMLRLARQVASSTVTAMPEERDALLEATTAVLGLGPAPAAAPTRAVLYELFRSSRRPTREARLMGTIPLPLFAIPEVAGVDGPTLLRALSHSISLSKDEKVRIVTTLPQLREQQAQELLGNFEEEQEKFRRLGHEQPKHLPELRRLAILSAFDWMEVYAHFTMN